MATNVKKIRTFRGLPPSLAAITIEGFKSIKSECRLELGNLNILAGANSAGKSSFTATIAFEADGRGCLRPGFVAD